MLLGASVEASFDAPAPLFGGVVVPAASCFRRPGDVDVDIDFERARRYDSVKIDNCLR